MGSVFISYSSKDSAVANQLKLLLNQNNIKTWMAPDDILAGFKYAEIITYAIKDCSCLVLLLTADAQNSNWVSREVERAVNYGKNILTIQLGNVELNAEFQLYISVNHLINIKKIDPESDDIKRLIESIKETAKSMGTESVRKYRVGDLIGGKYEVLKIIEESDYESILLTANKAVNKRWIVKVIYRTLSSLEKYGKEFSAEILRLNKQTNHPAVPGIIDIIDNDENIMFIKEYVEGETLSDVIKRSGAQSESDVLRVAIQIAEVLKYMHNANPPVYHVDLRPEQWVLGLDGELKSNGFLQLKKCCDNATTGTTPRSLAFVAPEEYESQKIDQRIDMYSLGVLLYSLITGKDFSKPPYVMLPVRANNPDLSKAMESIVLKCIEPNPENRYQDADKLLKDLLNIEKLNNKLEHPSVLRKLFPFMKGK